MDDSVLYLFICVCVCVRSCEWTLATLCGAGRGQAVETGSLPIMLFLEIQLKLSDMAASTFTQWAILQVPAFWIHIDTFCEVLVRTKSP